jgi:hypothetical protein
MQTDARSDAHRIESMRREMVAKYKEGYRFAWKRYGGDTRHIPSPAVLTLGYIRLDSPTDDEIERECSYLLWHYPGMFAAYGTKKWKRFLEKVVFNRGAYRGRWAADPYDRLQRERAWVGRFRLRRLRMPRNEKQVRDKWIEYFCDGAGNMGGAEEEADKQFSIWRTRFSASDFPRDMKGEPFWAKFRQQARDCGTDARKRYASEGKGEAAARQGGGKTLTDAVAWLQKALTANGGRMAKTAVMAASERAGFKQATLYRAKEQCGVKDKSSGFGRNKRADWILPSKDDPKPKAEEEALRKEYPHLVKARDEFIAKRGRTLQQFAKIADKHKRRRGKGLEGGRDMMSRGMVSLSTLPEPASYPDHFPAQPKLTPKGDDDDAVAYTINLNQILGKDPEEGGVDSEAAQRQAPRRIGDGEEVSAHHPDLALETPEQDSHANDEGRD